MSLRSSPDPHPILVQYGSGTVLPLDLVQAVNQTYFLHLLVTDPDKVVPSGKSLISVVVQERIGQAEERQGDGVVKIQQHIAEAMHAAFWDATSEKLSSQDPSEQNTHIKRLSNDIREAITPLLPPGHQLLHILSLPPAPSIAPLHSFIGTLKDVLVALRRRCAPLRDSGIDTELRKLDEPPQKEMPTPGSVLTGDENSQSGRTANVSALAKFTALSVKAIVDISDNMKSDLHSFLVGSMTECELRGLITREAKRRERDIVVKLWSFYDRDTGMRGEDIIREQWHNWCNEIQETGVPWEDMWKSRLIKSLSKSMPVSCVAPLNLPNSRLPGKNELPPQFFFASPSLHQLQDFLQAIAIAATLRSLTRLPSSLSPETSPAQTPAQGFMSRIWGLLNAELTTGASIGQDKDDIDALKLVNLADEVVHARRLVVGTLDTAEEQRLREAVGRTLQPHDPVFVLLQTRLMNGLLNGILSKDTPEGGPSRRGQMPNKLRTGRVDIDGHVRKRQELIIDDGVGACEMVPQKASMQAVKGFEDPILMKAIGDAFVRLSRVLGWTEDVWNDLV